MKYGLLKPQDWLTTLVEEDNHGGRASVTGAMIDFLPPGESRRVIERLSDPSIRIVSLTVTEGGYLTDPSSGDFLEGHPGVVEDAKDLGRAQTIFGMMLAALRRRRTEGFAPFTVVSCDNIPGNGHLTKGVLTGFARLVDPDFARWLEDEIACPNGMVDRITPATSERAIKRVADEFGVEDAAPVFCETFRQWVVEDQFPAGRPALEKVGVTLVADVEPYEVMKIRILNGGHAAISYAGALLDLPYVHEAMEDPQLRAFLLELGRREIIPLVPPVPDTDVPAYLLEVADRFANRKIADTVRRVCFDGSNRQPKYVLPTVLAGLRKGEPIEGLALISAMWCRYCYGTTESGQAIEANDPIWDRLQRTAHEARNDPRAFLAMSDIFGETARDDRYVAAFIGAVESLWARGVRATIANYLAG